MKRYINHLENGENSFWIFHTHTMDSTDFQPDIVENFLPVTVFLATWYVRVTWIAFTTLWVFWGFIWFLRHAFGGDGSHVNQTNTLASTNPPATATDPETGAAINTGATNAGTANTGAVNTAPATNKKKFLAAPTWGANVFVSILKSRVRLLIVL